MRLKNVITDETILVSIMWTNNEMGAAHDLAARTGVEAVLWARAGLTAANDGLAGPNGFGATHHAEGAEVELPGNTWRIMEISHKFHACCHGLHATLEALRGVDVDPAQVERISVRTHPRWMSVCNIAAPSTGLEAKFSYTQTCAMALLGHDTGNVASFSAEIPFEPEIVALRARVEVNEDETLTEMQADVTLDLSDGTTRHVAHDLAAPMSLETRAARLRQKALALLGEPLSEALWSASEGRDLAVFTDLLGQRLQE